MSRSNLPFFGDFAMLSKPVEYALRAVVFLGKAPTVSRTTEEIARGTQVPQAFLSKVLQKLTHKGIIRSQRGVGGGMTLVKSPAELTILEVVNAVDPIQRIQTCPLKQAAHGINLCPLHRRVDQALALVEDAF